MPWPASRVPPCGPSPLTAIPRKAGERTGSGLWDLIGKLIDIYRPDEYVHYFGSCGYDPECMEDAPAEHDV